MPDNKLNHIANILSIAHRRINAQMSIMLKPVGISVDMWAILTILENTPGQSMTFIADSLSLNLPTVTKLMDRMVSDNLAYRKPHHSDRRRVLIFPTEKGLVVFQEAEIIAKAIEQKIHNELGDLTSIKTQLSKGLVNFRL